MIITFQRDTIKITLYDSINKFMNKFSVEAINTSNI